MAEAEFAGLLGEQAVFHASGPLRVGLSSVSIAPNWPVVLPYGKQTPTTVFYNRNIFCKVLVLEVEKLTIAIVSLDVIGFGKGIADEIKARVEEETGIPKDFIILAAVHNHSYPGLSDPKVKEFIAKRTAEAVKRAINSTFQAAIGFKLKELSKWLTVNRSKVDGPVSTNVWVSKIADESGAIRGILFSFPAHPNIYTTAWDGRTLGKIGPEWPEYARKYIETHINLEQMFALYPSIQYRNTVTVFLLGAAGDLNPYTGRDTYKRRKMQGRRAFVEALGDGVLSLLKSIETTRQVNMTFKWATLPIPLKERSVLAGGRGYPALLQALTINDACIVAVPGEATAELGLGFQREAGFPHATLVTCANDSLGYFVSEAEGLEDVTYEAQGSHLVPHRGRLLVDAAISLVNPKHKPSRQLDPEKDMGRVEGTLKYRGRGKVFVGVKRVCAPPSYGDPPVAPFMGRRVEPSEGCFIFETLMPGTAFLYVDEQNHEGETPTILMWGKPVKIRAGRKTLVSIQLPQTGVFPKQL